MEEKMVRCPECGNVLYTIGKRHYIVGTVLIKHGFSGTCFCGYAFNTEWIQNDKRQ